MLLGHLQSSKRFALQRSGVHMCSQTLYTYELVCLSYLILLQPIIFTCSWTGPHANFASANVMHLQAYFGHGRYGSNALQLMVQEPTTKRSKVKAWRIDS